MTDKIEQERTKIVETLADLFAQAARASVAKGASYEPQEQVSLDTRAAWGGVAETIMKLVEVKVRESRQAEEEEADE